ncbi:MAG: hypothetical protein ACP5GU_09870 [Thermoprotei archaeon]
MIESRVISSYYGYNSTWRNRKFPRDVLFRWRERLSNKDVRYHRIVHVIDTQPIKLSKVEKEEIIILANKLLDGLFRINRRINADLVTLIALYLVLRKYRGYNTSVFSLELEEIFKKYEKGFYNALQIVNTRLPDIVRPYYTQVSLRNLVERLIIKMRNSILVSMMRSYLSDDELEYFFMKLYEYSKKVAEDVDNVGSIFSGYDKGILALACVFTVFENIANGIMNTNDFARLFNTHSNFSKKVPIVKKIAGETLRRMRDDQDVINILLKIMRSQRILSLQKNVIGGCVYGKSCAS